MAGLLLLTFTAGAYAQTGGKLGKIAILPFTGGATTDEQNGIPEWIAHTNNLTRNFDVTFRTDITQEAEWEQLFQHESGMIDSEKAVTLGNKIGAQYVMTGSITSLGNQKLLIVSIIDIQDIRQVAGDYLKYNVIDDVIRDTSILNNMAGNLIEMVRNQKDDLPPLALLRVRLEGGAGKSEGDAMAQILAIHLLREGGWAVCPRVTLEEVENEYKTQLESGTIRKSEQVRAGEAMVPRHVLAVVSRVIGTTNTFTADITIIEDGVWYDGSTEVYTSLNDGMSVMGILAKKLSGGGSEQVQASRAQAVKTDNFLRNSCFVFGAWVGLGWDGTGLGESYKAPDPVTGEEKEISSNPFSFFSGGGSIGLRYRFIGIQTGVNIIGDNVIYTPADGLKQFADVNILQIPILARLNFDFPFGNDGNAIGLGGFAGIGVNAAVLKSDAGPYKPGSLSFIAGAEYYAVRGGIGSLIFGYQWNGSISGGSITVDGVPYDYKSGIHIITVGVRFNVPLRKNN
jgi:TolB-like protein